VCPPRWACCRLPCGCNPLNLSSPRADGTLKLAQTRERVRRDILDTFEDIPKIIATACSKSQSFPEDAKLHDCIDDLKMTLFEAIPSLIEILMPEKFCG